MRSATYIGLVLRVSTGDGFPFGIGFKKFCKKGGKEMVLAMGFLSRI